MKAALVIAGVFAFTLGLEMWFWYQIGQIMGSARRRSVPHE